MIPTVPLRTNHRGCLCLLLAVILLATTPALGLAEGCLAQGCIAGTAADEFTADRAGLSREWILQLPGMAPASSLAEVVVGDGLVVAQTSEGAVHAVQSAPFGDAAPAAGSPAPGIVALVPAGRPQRRANPAGWHRRRPRRSAP